MFYVVDSEAHAFIKDKKKLIIVNTPSVSPVINYYSVSYDFLLSIS